MERGDNVVLGNMCENLPHEMVPITKFSAFSSWTSSGIARPENTYGTTRDRGYLHNPLEPSPTTLDPQPPRPTTHNPLDPQPLDPQPPRPTKNLLIGAIFMVCYLRGGGGGWIIYPHIISTRLYICSAREHLRNHP